MEGILCFEDFLTNICTYLFVCLFVCLTGELPGLDDHLQSLFRIVHVGPLATGIQSLMLLYHVMESQQGVSSRYYQALYTKLLDPRLKHSGKQASCPTHDHTLTTTSTLTLKRSLSGSVYVHACVCVCVHATGSLSQSPLQIHQGRSRVGSCEGILEADSAGVCWPRPSIRVWLSHHAV